MVQLDDLDLGDEVDGFKIVLIGPGGAWARNLQDWSAAPIKVA